MRNIRQLVSAAVLATYAGIFLIISPVFAISEQECKDLGGSCNRISESCEQGFGFSGLCIGLAINSACCVPNQDTIKDPTKWDEALCKRNGGICAGVCIESIAGKEIGACVGNTPLRNKCCGIDKVPGMKSEITCPETPPQAEPTITPKLGVPIPGLTFSTGIMPIDGKINLPFLSQYISAMYNYVIALSLIAASIVIVYGGFLYILGATSKSISSGKEKIAGAIIGLILVFSVMTILKFANPATTTLKVLSVKVVDKQDAICSPEAEFERVAKSSQAQPSEQIETVDIIETPGGQVVTSTVATKPDVIGAPSAPGEQPQGTVVPGGLVTDERGNLIAQGQCPEDMVAIPYSADYEAKTKENVQSFCIDRYEAPNKQGAVPLNGVSEFEADWYCAERGKRLCNIQEWVRACKGPKGENTYGYGPKFIPGLWVSAGVKDTWKVKAGGKEPGLCNYDTVASTGGPNFSKIYSLYTIDPKFSTLNPDFKKNVIEEVEKLKEQGDASKAKSMENKLKQLEAMRTEVTRLNKAEPSGTRTSCVTAEGVYDMTANIQEIVVSKTGSTMTLQQRVAKGQAIGGAKPYTWIGFYYSPIAHLANTSAEPSCSVTWGSVHPVGGWRAFENGFRCCMYLKP
ncbi:MAG: SUMF1/EgtB/PvdO family nonheme iron enzyme [Patescibacteria group bacterium]|nr:SUMF1/EgtB/PvdO family nonheme iron enzyme [Patescibacteria group bacterium]